MVLKGYVSEEKRKEIDEFIHEIGESRQWLLVRIDHISESIHEIENTISKSNPELSVDPQMEPLITLFVGDVEDVYSRMNESIARIKEFESTMFDVSNVSATLALTDSVISQMSRSPAGTPADESDSAKLDNARELQKKAWEESLAGEKKLAVKLSREAYNSVIDLFPVVQPASDMRTQYEMLKKQIVCTEELMEDPVNERIALLFSLAEEHVKNAGKFMQKQKTTSAQKELDISSVLITKVAKLLMKENE